MPVLRLGISVYKNVPAESPAVPSIPLWQGRENPGSQLGSAPVQPSPFRRLKSRGALVWGSPAWEFFWLAREVFLKRVYAHRLFLLWNFGGSCWWALRKSHYFMQPFLMLCHRIWVANLHVCVCTRNLFCLLFIFQWLNVVVRNRLRPFPTTWDSFMINGHVKFLIYLLYNLKT